MRREDKAALRTNGCRSRRCLMLTRLTRKEFRETRLEELKHSANSMIRFGSVRRTPLKKTLPGTMAPPPVKEAPSAWRTGTVTGPEHPQGRHKKQRKSD